MDKLVNVEARLDMIRYTSEIFYDECISESKKRVVERIQMN